MANTKEWEDKVKLSEVNVDSERKGEQEKNNMWRVGIERWQ